MKALLPVLLLSVAASAAAQGSADFQKCPGTKGGCYQPSQRAEKFENGSKLLKGQLVEVEVTENKTGAPFWFFNDGSKNWLGGLAGKEYSIWIKNNSSRRVLAVVSVDGLDVINGKTASYNQSGYIVGPYDSVKIEGWRKSMDEVAKFVFSSPQSSYANQTSRPANIGVVGVAVFEEDIPVRIMKPTAPSVGLDAEKSMRAQSAPSLGTEHGDRTESRAQYQEFKRVSSNPSEVLSFEYEATRVLVARGIAKVAKPTPNRVPFPAQEFTPDPPNKR